MEGGQREREGGIERPGQRKRRNGEGKGETEASFSKEQTERERWVGGMRSACPGEKWKIRSGQGLSFKTTKYTGDRAGQQIYYNNHALGLAAQKVID